MCREQIKTNVTDGVNNDDNDDNDVIITSRGDWQVLHDCFRRI